jgi:hypothetical protein
VDESGIVSAESRKMSANPSLQSVKSTGGGFVAFDEFCPLQSGGERRQLSRLGSLGHVGRVKSHCVNAGELGWNQQKKSQELKVFWVNLLFIFQAF